MDSDKKVFDITVNKTPKPAPGVKAKEVVEEPEAEKAFSVPVRSNLNAPTEEPEAEKAPLIEKHELKLTPDESIEEAVAEVEKTEVTEKVVTAVETTVEEVNPEPVAEESEPAQTENPAPAEVSTAPEEKTEPMSTEDSADSPAVVAKPAQGEPDSPVVFDTKQYHLPIKETKSHNPGKHMLGFVIVFLLVVAIASVAAIDAGWVNVGVKLPFDLIK